MNKVKKNMQNYIQGKFFTKLLEGMGENLTNLKTFIGFDSSILKKIVLFKLTNEFSIISIKITCYFYGA